MHKETGRIVWVGETQNVSKNPAKPFFKRELVLDTEDEGSKYKNTPKFEAVGEDCGLFDGLKIGEVVTVSFFLNGRDYQKSPTSPVMYFNALRVKKIERGAAGDTFAEAEAPADADADAGDDEDVPF